MAQTPRFFWTLRVVVFAVLAVMGAGVVWGQQPGTIVGTVVSARGAKPLVGVNVVVVGTLHAAVTGATGAFTIGPVPPGDYTLLVDVFSYQAARQTVEVVPGAEVLVRFRLEAEDVVLEAVEITAIQAATQPVAGLPEARLREHTAPALGPLVSLLPGVFIGRRSALAFVPSVRGLGGPRVGVFVEGLRLFAAEPYDTDTPLSYIDPLFVHQIEVVKGPQALTWGGGLMSALRVQTLGLEGAPTEPMQGTFQVGYGTNIGAFEAAGSLRGGQGNWAYGAQGAYRAGNDYEDGEDRRLEGDYRAGALRGHLAHSFGPSSRVRLVAAYQQQKGVEVPGTSTEVERRRRTEVSARFQRAWAAGLWRSVEAMASWGRVSHTLRAETVFFDAETEQTQLSSRLAAHLETPQGFSMDVGAEVYSVFQDAAQQRILPGDVSSPAVAQGAWEDVSAVEAGTFLHGRHTVGRVEASASARLDMVHTTAGRVQEAPGSLAEVLPAEAEKTDRAMSGAVALSTHLSPAWRISGGIGSVARIPGIHERYTRLLPAGRLLSNAVVLGNAHLRTERSTQADVWLEGTFPNLEVRLDGFGRRLRNYIFWEILPTSGPLPTLRPTNGLASFFGVEGALRYQVLRGLAAVRVEGAYLWGREETRDRPTAAVGPATATLAWRLNAPANLFFIELSLQGVTSQERVAEELGESPSEGYVTTAFRFGLTLPRHTSLLFGIDNLTDVAYAPHLNARDRFTHRPITEPGRVVFLRLRHDFR